MTEDTSPVEAGLLWCIGTDFNKAVCVSGMHLPVYCERLGILLYVCAYELVSTKKNQKSPGNTKDYILIPCLVL